MSKKLSLIVSLPVVVLSMFLGGCGSSAKQESQTPVTPPPSGTGVPATFFGMNQVRLQACSSGDLPAPFTNAPIGALRAWATCKDFWPDLNPAPGTYNWTGLDDVLSAADAAGVNDVFIQVERVPNWISSNPSDTLCDGANVSGELPGMCDPPKDLNADGTGTDLSFRSFATALLNHISNATYLSNHAEVKYIEIFDEFQRSDTLGGVQTLTGTVNTSGTAVTWVSGSQFGNVAPQDIMVIGGTSYTVQSITDSTDLVLTTSAGTQSGVSYTMSGCHNPTVTKANPAYGEPCSWRGTFAQMLRMLQDLRCIAKGTASDPISALGTTCGSAGYAQTGIDPALVVSVGNAGPQPDFHNGPVVMANFLYCNQSPPADSQCNWSSSNPLGSNATDMIGGHAYFNSALPEVVINWIISQAALFSAADKAKPYFVGEGSWGANTRVSDPGLQAAYVPRWYLALWMTGIAQRGYWWSWDDYGSSGSGDLWSPVSQPSPPGQCTILDPVGGYYCTGAIAYIQTVNWLSGATVTGFTCPGGCSNPSNGVFTFNITRSGGYQAEIAWDSSPTSSPCSNPQCGATALSSATPSFTAAQWRDVAGNTHTGSPSNIGAAPIIIENMTPP